MITVAAIKSENFLHLTQEAERIINENAANGWTLKQITHSSHFQTFIDEGAREIYTAMVIFEKMK